MADAGNDVYLYQFDQKPSHQEDDISAKPSHYADVYLLMTNELTSNNTLTNADRVLASNIMTILISFATSG